MRKRLSPSQNLNSRKTISEVLRHTRAEVEAARLKNQDKNLRALSSGKKEKRFKPELSFAISFGRHMGTAIARALEPDFPGIKSGETASATARGSKRLDLNYSTAEMGLGLAMSFKSVHFGEQDEGNRDFTHNLKRNDEELRVEATAHHLRQPYAVMVAIVFLPFETCVDSTPTSSFGRWVEYLWPLKGRSEPEDAPDIFELVFVGLYSRKGDALRFYQIGGPIQCPRFGRPKRLLSFSEFLNLVRKAYRRRNSQDFSFAGEA